MKAYNPEETIWLLRYSTDLNNIEKYQVNCINIMEKTIYSEK